MHAWYMQVNLVGGYYDAGDHVKFGLPMAFAVTMLSWGAVDFRKETLDLNQMPNTLAAIKWGTDYFIKAHTQPNLLWAQVPRPTHLSGLPPNIYINSIQFNIMVWPSAYIIRFRPRRPRT